MSSYAGPFHDLSPSDQAGIRSWSEPEKPLLCEFCDEQIDQIDVSVEAFEIMGGPCCVSCFQERTK